ncbi:N,N'-diacetylchitobiose transport system permease protein [Diaminobutyricimonas aerilata]|uniref:N,N'-diacetylchitobiose transport system permease protein n=1 Tax=Diaminobutyricimonas aerilata TaxID=1162967 RepID=A0A2M9CMI6_9MICO|nr:sugar ABC transporter permease [Diaminobutyricimonas aerilata]PJJ73110.1 N,N'-diacetylchitobiose transport system permease protein [Diaminobutyricimonas aerilata]
MTLAPEAGPALQEVDPLASEVRRVPPPPRRRAGRFTPLVLLVPGIAVLAAVIGWPLVQLLIMSFQEYGRAQAFGAPAPFNGLDNYIEVLGDEQFWAVLTRSIAFCIVNVALTIVLGTLVALMMTRLNRFFRLLVSVGLLLAWAMPALTATIVWGWLFDTQFGVVNYTLTQLTGIDFMGHSWLIDPVSFFAVATVIVTWGAVPFVAFSLYAGLTQVPGEVLEAAQLDGATSVQRFRLIVFPYLRSIFVVLTILSIIWDMRVFAQIYALQGIGGVREQTSTIGVYIYKTSLGTGEYGIGGATAVILVVILLAVSFFYVRKTIREEEL